MTNYLKHCNVYVKLMAFLGQPIQEENNLYLKCNSNYLHQEKSINQKYKENISNNEINDFSSGYQ